MINAGRQVLPDPSAEAWLFDLAGLGGPHVVVLRIDRADAAHRLAGHMTELGVAGDGAEATKMLERVSPVSAVVLW